MSCLCCVLPSIQDFHCYVRLNGFLLAIGKIQLLSDVGQTFQDEPTLWMPVKLNFVLFVPERGRRVRAIISKLGKKHIGKILIETIRFFFSFLSLSIPFSLFDTQSVQRVVSSRYNSADLS